MRKVVFVVFGLSLVSCAMPNHNQIASCGCAPPVGKDSELYLQTQVGDRVYFNFDSANIEEISYSQRLVHSLGLPPSAIAEVIRPKAVVARQAEWLTKHPDTKILIAGNADERGTETYNLALGLRRADTVRNYFVAARIAPDRIKTISYGKERPVAFGHDETSLDLNRTAITSVQGFNPQQ